MFSLAISSIPSCWRRSSAPDRVGELGIGLGERGGEEAGQDAGRGDVVHGGGLGRVMRRGSSTEPGRSQRPVCPGRQAWRGLQAGGRVLCLGPSSRSLPAMTVGRFPTTRMRRNRHDAWTRRLVAETPAVGRRPDLADLRHRGERHRDRGRLDAGGAAGHAGPAGRPCRARGRARHSGASPCFPATPAEQEGCRGHARRPIPTT